MCIRDRPISATTPDYIFLNSYMMLEDLRLRVDDSQDNRHLMVAFVLHFNLKAWCEKTLYKLGIAFGVIRFWVSTAGITFSAHMTMFKLKCSLKNHCS